MVLLAKAELGDVCRLLHFTFSIQHFHPIYLNCWIFSQDTLSSKVYYGSEFLQITEICIKILTCCWYVSKPMYDHHGSRLFLLISLIIEKFIFIWWWWGVVSTRRSLKSQSFSAGRYILPLFVVVISASLSPTGSSVVGRVRRRRRRTRCRRKPPRDSSAPTTLTFSSDVTGGRCLLRNIVIVKHEEAVSCTGFETH